MWPTPLQDEGCPRSDWRTLPQLPGVEGLKIQGTVTAETQAQTACPDRLPQPPGTQRRSLHLQSDGINVKNDLKQQ
jgi:hypothetical protein